MRLNEDTNYCQYVYYKQFSLVYYLILRSLNHENKSDLFLFPLWILSLKLIHLRMKKFHKACLYYRSTKQYNHSCCFQRKKLLACSCSVNRSNLLIAISEYEKELRAPIVVLFVCKRWLLSNTELLLYKRNWSHSNTHSVDGLFESLVVSANLTASIPLALSMLGMMLTMSNDTKIISSGVPFWFIVSMISSNWEVSLILQCIFSVKGAHILSINLDRFSIAVLQPVVSNRTGFLCLWVL